MSGGRPWTPLDDFLSEAWTFSDGLPEDGERARDRYREAAAASVATYGIGSTILEHVHFLRIVGTPEELDRKMDRLYEACAALHQIAVSPRTLTFLDSYSGRAGPVQRPDLTALDRLESWRSYLDDARADAETAVRSLRADGFEYAGGRLHVVDTGGRPRKVVSEVVAHVWSRMRPRYREETGDPSLAPKELLARLRGSLSRVFPLELLTDAALRSAIQAHGSG